MRIVVTSEGNDLEAAIALAFDRCATYVFVDLPEMRFEVYGNPAAGGGGGAGSQAAQFVVECGVQAVLTGQIGPLAYDVFQKAGLPILLIQGGTVRQAVKAYESGELQHLMGPNLQQSEAHPASYPEEVHPYPVSSGLVYVRERELADLKSLAHELQRQVTELLARIDHLEKNPPSG